MLSADEYEKAFTNVTLMRIAGRSDDEIVAALADTGIVLAPLGSREPPPRVEWHGDLLDVFVDLYNSTWLNERGAELAVVERWWDRTIPAYRTLELGNVLSHYPTLAHDGWVVDRWEQAPGVDNRDVFDITVDEPLLQIVAVSTVEHVRWDEPGRRPGGSQAAVEHLLGLLAPGGRMLVTVPGGHNAPLDRWLATGAGADRCCTLVRDMTSWRQTSTLEFRPYGVTQAWAESVWIGEWTVPG